MIVLITPGDGVLCGGRYDLTVLCDERCTSRSSADIDTDEVVCVITHCDRLWVLGRKEERCIGEISSMYLRLDSTPHLPCSVPGTGDGIIIISPSYNIMPEYTSKSVKRARTPLVEAAVVVEEGAYVSYLESRHEFHNQSPNAS